LREKYGDLAVEYIAWKDYIETVKKKGSKKADRSRANEKPIQGRAKKNS
jgi:hypothetical protein